MKNLIKKVKNWVVRHKTPVIAGLCVAALAGGALGYRAGETAASGAKREIPIYCVDRDDKVVALSFDAAWGDEDTPDILRILDEYGVKATFFLVGQWVDKYPHQVKAMHDGGHDVMNHSDTHPHMAKLSRDQIKKEAERCNEKIEAITGESPTLFRCPYGEYNNAVIETLSGIGMFTIQWDVDSLDWKDLSAAEIKSRVTSRIKPGSIVLFHNAAKHTPEALPGIIEWIIQNGYTAVKVSDLIYKDNYTINHEGRQIPN